MNIIKKIDIPSKILQAVIFKKKYPLSIIWNITSRCNLSCKYCNWGTRKGPELGTKEIINLVGEAASAGTKFINFSGGEPLLREDLPEIINFCKKKNIYVSVVSNGTLVKEKKNRINRVDMIKFSLDGPRSINDFIRGEGVHDKVIRAVEICKNEGIRVGLTTVLSRYNTGSVPYILDIAKKYDVRVYFKPADQDNSGDSNRDISFALPKLELFREAINLLRREKAKGNKHISNSISGLKKIYQWPGFLDIDCLISLISCVINPDGKIFVCDDFPNYQKYLKPIKGSFKETFRALALPCPCKRCWNSFMVEFNSISSFNPRNLWEILVKYHRDYL